MIRSGVYHYETKFGAVPYRCLYRNYLGEYFDANTTFVELGEFYLDEQTYQSIVEDLALENIESKVLSKLNSERSDCEIQ
jgi:hypothetical protein